MEYLHKHKEEFINAVNLASEYFHILPVIVEKDYYVTMILRELTERQGFVARMVRCRPVHQCHGYLVRKINGGII